MCIRDRDVIVFHRIGKCLMENCVIMDDRIGGVALFQNFVIEHFDVFRFYFCQKQIQFFKMGSDTSCLLYTSFAYQYRNNACVCRYAAVEYQNSFYAFEFCQCFFQFVMDCEVTDNVSAGTGTNTIFVNGFLCCGYQIGVVSQTQIVVGGHIDDFSAVQIDVCTLRAIKGSVDVYKRQSLHCRVPSL